MCQSGNTSSIKAELDGKICSEPLYIWKDWGQLDEPPRTVSSKKGKKKKRYMIQKGEEKYIHKTNLTYIMGDFQCQQPPLERV